MSTETKGRLSILVRLGAEVTTKARRTRQRFQDRLIANIRDALRSANVEFRVQSRWSRILVEASDRVALSRIASVFGVSSVSEIEARVPADLERIVAVGEELYRERVRGKKFAVEARRAGIYPFNSQDVRVQLGAALNQYAAVDLDEPDVTVSVEVREGEAFLYSDRLPGVRGLPLGVEGKAVCLISGGFDSAAAAWLMLKRGISLDYVFCNLGGEAYERSVVSVAKVLGDEWSYGDRPRIHVVDYEKPLAALQSAVRDRYWQVILKRLMYRTAERIATDLKAEAIVTGEAVGQVSSQTLGNLRAIDDAVSLPVFRPLLGFEKEEIVALAERIGTAPISARVREYCAIVPDKPVTHARPEAARDEESRVDLSVLDAAIAERKVLDLRKLEGIDLVQPYLFVTEVPPGAVVIDCREPHHYAAWHYPGAERRDLHEVVTQLKKLDKSRSYILYCNYGVQTAHVAELLQRQGYEAYSFRDGLRGIMKYAAAQGVPVGRA